MNKKELIWLLKDGYDPAPEFLHREIERLSELCEMAAKELELDDLKIRQLAEINDEMTSMVLIQSKHLREYENMSKVKRIGGI